MLGVDLSRSVGQEGREKAREVLEAVGHAKSRKRARAWSCLAARRNGNFCRARDFPPADFASRLDREETDIQAALQAALAQIGEERQGKILLLSDGNENRGETSRIIPLLRSQGTQVWTLPVSLSRGRNEVYLSDLASPRQVDSGEGFEVKGKIESLRDAPARVKLLRDGVLAREQELQLRSGTNQVSFRESLYERGNHSYELLLEARDDTLAENNLLQGVVEVKGAPRVLLLSGNNDSQQFLSKALQVQGYSVVQSAPEKTSMTLTGSFFV